MRLRLGVRAECGFGLALLAALLAAGCAGAASKAEPAPDLTGGTTDGGRRADATGGSGRADAGEAGGGASSQGGFDSAGTSGADAGAGASGGDDPNGARPGGGAVNGGRSGGTGGRTASSGGEPGTGNGGVSGGGLCGSVLCTGLRNVQPGKSVDCEHDQCVVPPSSCVRGFAHCTNNPLDGCETDISLSTSCGACGVSCPPENPVCGMENGVLRCVSACVGETPVFCTNTCADLQTNFGHCGACDKSCTRAKNIDIGCREGQCVPIGECYPGTANCSGDVDCEPLDTPENCGACGRNDCGAAHASPDCTDPSGCLPPVCDSGYANCDRTNPDCEVPYSGGCFPSYLGTLQVPGVTRVTTATYGSDGSYFLAGVFSGQVDFDPSSATDILDSGNNDKVFITKLAANGGYAWTRAFGSTFPSSAVASAAGPNGAIIVTGTFTDVVDFDPGAGSTLLGSAGSERAYVLELTAQGTFAWARAWSEGTKGTALVADGTSAFYAAGTFSDSTDIDPGPGTDERQSNLATAGYVVRLNAAGNYVRGSAQDPCSSLTVGRDGKLWCLNGGTFTYGVSAFDQTGEATFGAYLGFMHAATMVAGADGAIYIAGSFGGTIGVLNDNPERRRQTPGDQPAALLLVLNQDGDFVRTRAVSGYTFVGLAPVPGGGVLALAQPNDPLLATGPASLFGYHTDGASSFRLAVGSIEGTPLLGANATEFFVAGSAANPTDFDPGQALEVNQLAGAYVSRFRF